MSTNQPNMAETLLSEVRETRAEVATLAELARILAKPSEDGAESFLQLMLDTQNRLIDGVAQIQNSLQSLHKSVTEPGIAATIKRLVAEE